MVDISYGFIIINIKSEILLIYANPKKVMEDGYRNYHILNGDRFQYFFLVIN